MSSITSNYHIKLHCNPARRDGREALGTFPVIQRVAIAQLSDIISLTKELLNISPEPLRSIGRFLGGVKELNDYQVIPEFFLAAVAYVQNFKEKTCWSQVSEGLSVVSMGTYSVSLGISLVANRVSFSLLITSVASRIFSDMMGFVDTREERALAMTLLERLKGRENEGQPVKHAIQGLEIKKRCLEYRVLKNALTAIELLGLVATLGYGITLSPILSAGVAIAGIGGSLISLEKQRIKESSEIIDVTIGQPVQKIVYVSKKPWSSSPASLSAPKQSK